MRLQKSLALISGTVCGARKFSLSSDKRAIYYEEKKERNFAFSIESFKIQISDRTALDPKLLIAFQIISSEVVAVFFCHFTARASNQLSSSMTFAFLFILCHLSKYKFSVASYRIQTGFLILTAAAKLTCEHVSDFTDNFAIYLSTITGDRSNASLDLFKRLTLILEKKTLKTFFFSHRWALNFRVFDKRI